MWIDDIVIEQMDQSLTIKCWVPDKTSVVLGAGNEVETEVHVETCKQFDVPILRRYGGGGTVLLHEGCIVLSVGTWVKNLYGNSEYFGYLNTAVQHCLGHFDPVFKELSQNGISDICYKDKKVAGTSMFRSKHYLLYQASILCEIRLSLIEKFLKHPSKEPGYRKARTHGDFLTGLTDILAQNGRHAQTNSKQIKEHLEVNIGDFLEMQLKDHLIAPKIEEFSSLAARLERARQQSESENSPR